MKFSAAESKKIEWITFLLKASVKTDFISQLAGFEGPGLVSANPFIDNGGNLIWNEYPDARPHLLLLNMLLTMYDVCMIVVFVLLHFILQNSVNMIGMIASDLPRPTDDPENIWRRLMNTASREKHWNLLVLHNSTHQLLAHSALLEANIYYM